MAADTVRIATMHTAGRNFGNDLFSRRLLDGNGSMMCIAEVGLIGTPSLLLIGHRHLEGRHLALMQQLALIPSHGHRELNPVALIPSHGHRELNPAIHPEAAAAKIPRSPAVIPALHPAAAVMCVSATPLRCIPCTECADAERDRRILLMPPAKSAVLIPAEE